MIRLKSGHWNDNPKDILADIRENIRNISKVCKLKRFLNGRIFSGSNFLIAALLLVVSQASISLGGDTPNQQSNLKIFSIINKSHSKNGAVTWTEKFYLVNESDEPISITSALISATGPDEKGKIGIKTISTAKVGGGGETPPSVILQSKMLWQFSSLTWLFEPSSAPCNGEISTIRKKNDELGLIKFGAITRYVERQ